MLNVILRRSPSTVRQLPRYFALNSSVSPSFVPRCCVCSAPPATRLFDKLVLGKVADESAWEELRAKVEAGLETRLSSGKWLEVRKAIEMYLEAKNDVFTLQEMINNPENEELRLLAKEDLAEAEEKTALLYRQMLERIGSYYSTDSDEVIFEVSAGVGGQEAMLFAGELFAMYEAFVRRRGWSWDLLSQDQTDLGGIRSGTSEIRGTGAYSVLKYEGGVHRVQRVPATEKAGRIHTSTVTVAILPVLPEAGVKINPNDLKVETMRSSGAGGQHVNRTESKVRLTHLPSGLVVECQEQRDQHKNKAKALKVLSARLTQIEADQRASKLFSAKRIQIGSRGRSEKIRTYNFNQDRVTDHRISHSTHGLDEYLQSGEGLDEIIDLLRREEAIERVSFLSDIFN